MKSEFIGPTMLQSSSAVSYMKLQGHNFHFNFPSTSPDKVWMWHEMRYGIRANWYLINARPDWRAQAHLLHVSSNIHDLQAGFLPQQTFHAIRSISVKWCTQPAQIEEFWSARIMTNSMWTLPSCCTCNAKESESINNVRGSLLLSALRHHCILGLKFLLKSLSNFI